MTSPRFLLRSPLPSCASGGAVAAVVIRHEQRRDALALGADALRPPVMADGGCTLITPVGVTPPRGCALVGSQVEFEGTPYAVKRVIAHPDASGPAGAPPDVDLALIEFTAPVAGVQPIPLYKGRDELGRPAFVVGYGDYGVAGAFQRTDGKRRAVTNEIDDVGPKRVFMTFDAPPSGSAFEGVGGGRRGGTAFIGWTGGSCGRRSAAR